MEQEVLGRINRLLSFSTTWTAQKTTPPTIIFCRVNVFTKLLPSNDRGIYREAHRLSFDKTRTAYKMTCPTSLLYLAFIICRGNVFAEPLPNNEKRDTLRAIV
jgi:hypothetical protein